MRYDSVRGVNALLSEPISKSSADKGRVGLVGWGRAFVCGSGQNPSMKLDPEFDILKF